MNKGYPAGRPGLVAMLLRALPLQFRALALRSLTMRAKRVLRVLAPIWLVAATAFLVSAIVHGDEGGIVTASCGFVFAIMLFARSRWPVDDWLIRLFPLDR
jgi:hypothetical protein